MRLTNYDSAIGTQALLEAVINYDEMRAAKGQ
jgi:hypothetical protein